MRFAPPRAGCRALVAILLQKNIGCRNCFQRSSRRLMAFWGAKVSAAEAHACPGNQYSVVVKLSFGLASVLAVKALDAPGGVHQLLLAGEERVAVRADFKANLRLGRARFPGRAASAMHVRRHVLRMNIWFHFVLLSGIF